MYTPYEIDHKMSKENAERVARQVENHRRLPRERDEKAVGGLRTTLAVALGMVVAFIRGA
jgi:hypothetical protein